VYGVLGEGAMTPEIDIVIGKDGDMTCPMCGAEVRVVGEVTLSYEPVAEVLLDEALGLLGIGVDVSSPITVRLARNWGTEVRRFLARPEVKALLERGEG
jgi:hypothetical protein